MPNQDELPDHERLPEKKMRKVLERAIQIDAERAGDTTIAELRQVAEELNISPKALMQALQEVRAVQQPAAHHQAAEKPGMFKRALGWVRTAGLTIAGVLVGAAVGGNYRPAGGGDLVSAIMIMTLAALAVTVYDHIKKNPLGRTRIDILLAFGAFLFSFSRSTTITTADPAEAVAMGLIVSLIGTIILPRIKLPGSKGEPKQEFTAA